MRKNVHNLDSGRNEKVVKSGILNISNKNDKQEKISIEKLQLKELLSINKLEITNKTDLINRLEEGKTI